MKKKSLIMLLCAVLVVSSVAMGTIAYLTSSTSVTNTFTVGKVKIDVDEAKVNENGEPMKNGEVVTDLADADRTTDPESEDEKEGNQYRMVPGKTYFKDPTVTVFKGSEDAYVRMIVRITEKANVIEAFGADCKVEELVDLNKDWKFIGKTMPDGKNYIEYEFRYKDIVKAFSAEQNMKLPALFTHFTIPTDLDGDDLEKIQNMQIIVEGHAIQATTFTAEDEPYKSMTEPAKAAEDDAWAAFDQQIGGN